MKQERKYQTEAIETVFAKLEKGIDRQIIALATGGGKTYTAAKIAHRFKRILFLTHVEELAEQAGAAMLNEFYPEISINEVIEQHGGLIPYFRYLENNKLFVTPEEASRFGIIKADLFKIDNHITIGSLQTIHRRLDRIPADHFDLVIIDECHMSGAVSFKKTLDYFTPKLLIGLTATPYRADGASLSDIFQEIVYQYGIYDAIQDGYLCELDAIQIKTDINLDNVRTTAGEFNQKDLKQEVDTPERNKLVFESWVKYAHNKRTLIFAVDVEHAQNLCSQFKNEGYAAEFVVGDIELSPDRRGIINRFRSGETMLLINVAILIAGADFPFLECLINAAPTKSLTRFIQIIGRGTRTLPGVIDGIGDPIMRKEAIRRSKKPHCIILDIVDNSSRHKIVNTWTLDKDKPIEKRVFTTQEKKDKLIEFREKRKFEAQVKEDRRINLFELPKIKFSNAAWIRDPATPAQIEKLRTLGFEVEDKTFTKGDANRLICNADAPMNWIYALKKLNYNVSNGVSREEAIRAFKESAAREAKKKETKELGDDIIVQGL